MASRERDSGRSYASGSQKQKNKINEGERENKDAASNKKITDMLVRPKAVYVTAHTTEFESLVVEDTLPSLPSTSHSSPPSLFDSSVMIDISLTADFSLNDTDSWPKIISNSIRQSFIAEKFDQKLDINFKSQPRFTMNSLFNFIDVLRKLANCEIVKRTWLVYCSACKLFSNKENAFTRGFDDWKNGHRIGEHENTDAHRNYVMSWKKDCIDTFGNSI